MTAPSQCGDGCELALALVLTNVVAGAAVLLRRQWKRWREQGERAPIEARQHSGAVGSGKGRRRGKARYHTGVEGGDGDDGDSSGVGSEDDDDQGSDLEKHHGDAWAGQVGKRRSRRSRYQLAVRAPVKGRVDLHAPPPRTARALRAQLATLGDGLADCIAAASEARRLVQPEPDDCTPESCDGPSPCGSLTLVSKVQEYQPVE